MLALFHTPFSLTVLGLALGAIAGLCLGFIGLSRGETAATALKRHAIRRWGTWAALVGIGAILAPLARYQRWAPDLLVAWGPEITYPVLAGIIAMAGVGLLVLEWPGRFDRIRRLGLEQAAGVLLVAGAAALWNSWPAQVSAQPVVERGITIQTTESTCVPSSIATLLRVTGVDPEATEADLVEAAGTTENGTGITGEREAFKLYGVHTRLRRGMTPNLVLNMTHPAVLHLRARDGSTVMNHAVALIRVDKAKRRMLVADPVGGLSWQQVSALTNDMWWGELVEMDRTPFPSARKRGVKA